METLSLIASQFAVIVPVLVFVLAPMSIAGWLLLRQKRKAREARVSPLVRDLLRFPGQTLRDQLEEGRIELAWEAAMLFGVPGLLGTILLLQHQILGRPVSTGIMVLLTLAVVAFTAFQTRRVLALNYQIDQWRLGFDAEAAAGQDLDQLMRQGAFVFHDIPGEKFNVDHVVVAVQGIFAVETKGYRKPNDAEGGTAKSKVVYDGQALQFPDWSSNKPLAQAERQARWVGEWLSKATGDDLRATPVLVLPGWFVELKGWGAVRVFNNSQLKDLLRSRDTQRLTAAQVTRIAHQLEQRCRNVKPTYRAETEEK